VGVKLYDDGGKVIVIYAKDLLKFSEASNKALGIQIALTAVEAIVGTAVGKLAGKAVGKAWALTSRKVIQPALVSTMLGTSKAAPTAFGQLASRTRVELVERPTAASIIAQQTVRQYTRQVAERAVVQSATRGTQAAEGVISGARVAAP
jgi:hypothetical protein